MFKVEKWKCELVNSFFNRTRNSSGNKHLVGWDAYKQPITAQHNAFTPIWPAVPEQERKISQVKPDGPSYGGYDMSSRPDHRANMESYYGSLPAYTGGGFEMEKSASSSSDVGYSARRSASAEAPSGYYTGYSTPSQQQPSSAPPAPDREASLSQEQRTWRPDDWMCPDPSCASHNFSSRQECKMCGAPKPTDGKTYSADQNVEFKKTDWVCSNFLCKSNNFGWRQRCQKCEGPKPESTDATPLRNPSHFLSPRLLSPSFFESGLESPSPVSESTVVGFNLILDMCIDDELEKKLEKPLKPTLDSIKKVPADKEPLEYSAWGDTLSSVNKQFERTETEIDLVQVQSDESPKTCSEHDEELIYWCKEDQIMVCQDCFIFGKHRSHTPLRNEEMR